MRNMGNQLGQCLISPFVVLRLISISLSLFVSKARGALFSKRVIGYTFLVNIVPNLN